MVFFPRHPSTSGLPQTSQLQVDPGDCKAVRNDAVSGVQLPTMDEDEPAWLSFVIARYLDEERLPGMVNLC